MQRNFPYMPPENDEVKEPLTLHPETNRISELGCGCHPLPEINLPGIEILSTESVQGDKGGGALKPDRLNQISNSTLEEHEGGRGR